MNESNKNIYNLSPKEQKNTGTYKILCHKIGSLEESLKKTQDSLEKSKKKMIKLEKENAIYKHKTSSIFWIEFSKFLSSAGIGIALNFLLINNITPTLAIGIPSIIVYIISILFSNK